MYRLLAVVLVVGIGTGLLGCSPDAAVGQSASTSYVSLHVEGMMCAESCAKSVEEILAAQGGVREVIVRFEDKLAVCKVEPAVFDADAAVAELADQDFVATVEK